jgi:CRP-like cAMP-binding protein
MDALTFLSAHVPLFAGVSEDNLSPLAASAALKSYSAGQTVLFAGMSVEFLHVVATGTVIVQAKVLNKGMVRLAELSTGAVVGEASILEGSLAGATVKAGEAGAVVLLIPEETFRGLVSKDEAFGARVRDMIQQRRAPPAKLVAA